MACPCRSLAEGAGSAHTPTMSLKNAALLALTGMILMAILSVGTFIADVFAVARGLIPAVRLLTSLVYSLAAVSVAVFFYVFHRAQ